MKKFYDEGLNIKKNENVLYVIDVEDKKQIKKWGNQERTLPEWLMFLTEEVGELAEAIAQEMYGEGHSDFICKEASHVATLALKILDMVMKKQADQS